MAEEEKVLDNKTVLREALQSLDVRGRKAPATDEVCDRAPCAASPTAAATLPFDHETHRGVRARCVRTVR